MLDFLRTGWISVIATLLVLGNCHMYVFGQSASQDIPHGNVVPPAMAPGHTGNIPSQPNVVGVDPRFSDGANVHRTNDIPPNQPSGAAASGPAVPNAVPDQPVHIQQHIVPEASGQNAGNVMQAQADGTLNQVHGGQTVSPGMVNANQMHPSQVNNNFANQHPPPNMNAQNFPNDHIAVQPPSGGGQPQAQGNFQGHPNQLPAAHAPPHIPSPVENVPLPGHLPTHQSVGGNVPIHGGIPMPQVPQQFGHHPGPGAQQGLPHHDQAPDVYNQFRHAHEMSEPPRPRSHDENPPDEFVSMTVIVPPGSKNCYFYTPMLDFIVYHQVVRGGGMDIGLRVVDPEGRNVISQRPSEDGKFSITVPSHFRMRPYAICFDNRKATFGEKYVSVMVDVDVNWDNPSEEDKKALDILRKRSFAGAQIPEMKREYIESWRTIDERVEGLYGRLHRIKLLQQRSNNFAAVDKALMESNLSRVSSRSIVQVILMFGVATFQVMLIRAFFDPDSRFYRIWFGKRSIASARC